MHINDDKAIPVPVLVVPLLSSKLPSQTIPYSCFSNLINILLADQKFNSSSRIDLLIGGDFFPSIVCTMFVGP